ncbi:MAG: RNA polymerase sigma factor [Acidobacteria bacterium]|nr:RNA polymerase sigma factor [Acidobacteriota bacterium]
MLASSAPSSSESIDELIERCLAGDERAWDRIVTQHWRRVFNVAYKFVGRHDVAEDLTQDIFLKIFRALGTFDRRANFQTWLISVSRNLCIDHYRSVRKERELVDRSVDAEDASPVSREPDALTALERSDRRVLLHRALEQLPDTLRTAVLMRDIQEQSYREIARELDLPEGTVKSRINRGRHELARQIRRLISEAEARTTRAGSQQPAAAPRGASPPEGAGELPRAPAGQERPEPGKA